MKTILLRAIYLMLLLSSTGFSVSAQQPASKFTGKADSLFFGSNWQAARIEYEQLLKKDLQNKTNALFMNRLGFCYQSIGNYDDALNCYKTAEADKPKSPVLQQTIYSRMAKTYAAKNDLAGVTESLDKAVAAGYTNFSDMDSAAAYASFQQEGAFKKVREKAYFAAYPCMANKQSHDFDFWIGEWDAYGTGTKILQGHSMIERASGGCMILENWTSVGAPYSGKSMNFIDGKTGKWQQVWVGSEKTAPNIFINGEYRDHAMHFDFEQLQNGIMLKGRFTFFNEGPDRVRQLNETSSDAGKTWTTVYDFTYIRKK